MKKILGMSGLLIMLFSITAFADINKELIKASKKGKVDDVYQLLRRGADVNVKGRKNMTPLHYASAKGHIEVVHILLESGADINARDNKGRVPQELALTKQRMKVLVLLKEQRLKYDWGSAKEQNSISGYNDYINKYPDGSFSVDAKLKIEELSATRDLKVLSESMDESNIAEIQRLIEAGADANVMNKYGVTPLLIASEKGYTEVVKLLLEAGVDANKADTKNGDTPLLMASQLDHAEVVRLLLEAGANDVNKVGSGGGTTLYMASQDGYTEVVKLLLEAGADVNKARTDGWTPLLVASHYGYVEVVKLLLDANADINNANIRFRGKVYTALSQALGGNHTRIVKLLKEYGGKEQVEGRTESTSSWYEDGYMHYEIHRTGPGADKGWYGN